MSSTIVSIMNLGFFSWCISNYVRAVSKVMSSVNLTKENVTRTLMKSSAGIKKVCRENFNK